MNRVEIMARWATPKILAAITWIGVLIMFSPIAWMILTSFKTEKVAVSFPPKLFFDPTVSHYLEAFASGFWKFALNSVIAAGVSTVVALVLAVPAAYALAVRPINRWKDALFFLITTKMLPLAAAIVPLYLVAREVGLLNTTTLLVIVYVSMNVPLAVWMLRSFMAEIPKDIFDAVSVDGAGKVRELLTVVLPLIKPGIAATALLCGIFAWNEFFLAVNLTTFNSTLPVFLQKFLSHGELYTAQVAAVAVLVNVPVVIAGWLAQGHVSRGLTFGAVK